MPINDVLDISGWDISKTLRLLYRSNPTLFEWVSSPVVYIDTGFLICSKNRSAIGEKV